MNDKIFYEMFQDEMFESESEIVNEKFVERGDTYNIKCGGNGGWDHIDTAEICKGLAPVKNNEGTSFLIPVDDPRYLNGEYKHINKGRRYIYKGSEQKSVPIEELPKWKKSGWKEGKIKHATEGTRAIHKDNEQKFIFEKDIVKWEEAGWKKGALKSGTEGTKWVNNGKEQKLIKQEELTEYLENGWEEGSGYSPMEGKTHSKESKEKMSKKRKGRKWMNKNSIQTLVPPEKVTEYLENRWNFGRVKK